VARIIAAAPGLKYRTAVSVTYGAGLRASETASLKVSNIDSSARALRMRPHATIRAHVPLKR
jgi:site-specific recombinase XerD